MAKRQIPDPNFQVPLHRPAPGSDDKPCEVCGGSGQFHGYICKTCGGCGYMVDGIKRRDGSYAGWLCSECKHEGRERSFKVFQGITYHWVTAMYERYDSDGESIFEDRRVQAPYATWRCAWGHEDTDGY